MKRSQVMTHPITPPKRNPVYSFYVLTTLSRSVRRCYPFPPPVLHTSVSFHLPILRTCFSNVGPCQSCPDTDSCVNAWGCIVRPFTHLQAKQSIYNACHGPRNRCTSEINSIPYDDTDVRKDFYRRALFPLLG